MEYLVSFAILILSIILHEVAHGYAADSLGDPTARLSGRLTLNPLPHIDLMGSIIVPGLLALSSSPIFFGWAKPVPYNPFNLSNKRWGEAMVAVAGSATNMLVAVIFGLVVRFGPGFGMGEGTLSVAALIAFINLFLGLFNLIPFPPLDGWTVLRSALPWHLSESMNRLEASVRASGIVALLFFLIIFSLLFVKPFFYLIMLLFGLITGGA